MIPTVQTRLARALLPFVRSAGKQVAAEERCEICSAPIADTHRHLVDLEARTLACACSPCALLFTNDATRTWRTVPERVLHDPALVLPAQALADAGMPVRLAFAFFHAGLRRHVCIYPGPAGTTEAELEPAAWDALAARSRLFTEAAPDVEAILFHGDRGRETVEVFLVGIDRCYELTGALRRQWKGFDGGDEVRREMADFFAGLRKRSRPLREAAR